MKSKTLEFVEVTDAELDNDSWEAAEKQYEQGNTQQALVNLKSYVNSFPNGLHALKANYYLADLYFKKGETTNSVPHYEYLIAKNC